MKKYLVIISLFSLFVVSCGTKQQGKKEVIRVENVEVISLESQKISRDLEYSTTLLGYEEINIAPSIQGNIEHIYVEPGAKVVAGQLLVRMDQTQLNSAKVNKNAIATELARTEALLKAGNIAQSVYDQVKAQHDVAEENFAFLQKNTFIKAPFSGVVASKNYENGEMYSPAKPILKISQISRLKAYINIPESYFPIIKPNLPINILSDIYPNDIFKGKIETIYPTIDATSHTFTVKIDIPNSSLKLRPGMFSHTMLSLGNVDAIIVPYQAVLKQQGSNNRYVFIKKGDTAKRINVVMGKRFDDMTEIMSDSIKQGDEIIVVGQGKLIDGIKINVVDVAKKQGVESINDSVIKR